LEALRPARRDEHLHPAPIEWQLSRGLRDHDPEQSAVLYASAASLNRALASAIPHRCRSQPKPEGNVRLERLQTLANRWKPFEPTARRRRAPGRTILGRGIRRRILRFSESRGGAVGVVVLGARRRD